MSTDTCMTYLWLDNKFSTFTQEAFTGWCGLGGKGTQAPPDLVVLTQTLSQDCRRAVGCGFCASEACTRPEAPLRRGAPGTQAVGRRPVSPLDPCKAARTPSQYGREAHTVMSILFF